MKNKLLTFALAASALVGAVVLAQVPKPPASGGGSGVADGGAPMFSAATVAGALTVGGEILADAGVRDPSGQLVLTGGGVDGGTGVVIDNTTGFDVSGSKILSLKNAASEVGYVGQRSTYWGIGLGTLSSEGAVMFVDKATLGTGYLELRGNGELLMLGGSSYITTRGLGLRNDNYAPLILRGGRETGNIAAINIYPFEGTTTSATKLTRWFKDQGTTEVAHITGLGGGSFGVGSTSGNMLTIPEGTGITIDNGTTVFATQDTSTHTVTLKSGVVNANNRVGFIFDTTNNLTNSGTMMAQFKLAGTTKLAIDKSGNISTVNNVTATGDITGSYITASNDLQAPSGSVIGDTVNAYTTLSTDGTLQDNNKVIDTTAGDSATANSFAFRFRKDNSGASFAVTSDKVTANSVPACNIMSAASGVTIDSVVPTSGTLTINFSAAPAGNVDVNCIVMN